MNNIKLIIVPVIVIGLISAFVWYRNSLVNQGYKQAIREVIEKDSKSRAVATEVAANVEACVLSGGSWSVVNGACSLPVK